MSQTPNTLDIKQLSIPERILLVEEIWDSIVEEQETLELTDAQREELDRRLAAHRADPDAAIPWDEVKRRIGTEK